MNNTSPHHLERRAHGPATPESEIAESRASSESIANIASTLHSQPNGLRFHEKGLDPLAADFDGRAWVKQFVKLHESDPKSAPPRALGVAFSNLNVTGYNAGDEYQNTVASIYRTGLSRLASLFKGNSQKKRVHILRDFEGVVEKGELLLVLGPPGSGCSTLLKSLAGETAGLQIAKNSNINFRGIDLDLVRSAFRGDVLYNAELDVHLPQLTVGETLTFAARARSVRHVPEGLTRRQMDELNRDVMIALFGLNHTIDTKVGDHIIRGVSGGERKRVSIAEAALTGAKFQCWDNATRGLDSENAINFCTNLRLQADVLGVAAAVSIYQAPQSAYNMFDRVTVIYQGRQIYYGRATNARRYFEDLGFECPARQTTADFLTSITSPGERRVRVGCEDRVPHTPDEFASMWKSSSARKELLREIEEYSEKHPSKQRLAEYRQSRGAEKAKMQRKNSPYTISYPSQVALTLWRAGRRLKADPSFTIIWLVYHIVISLILGSMFYNLSEDSASFFYRGGLIFFALLFNAFSSQIEVLTIYAERPTVEKHNYYAFYHQSAQAIASYLIDLPYKIINMIVFNLTIYFMGNLNRRPGNFFFFCLTTTLTTFTQSAIFRTLACLTRTPEQAMVPTALLTLGLIVYPGYTMPTAYMPGWSRWMNYVNPIAYSFEALMVNEFHGREYPCVAMVPQGNGYDDVPPTSQICSVVGATPGSAFVSGDNYINSSFGYYNSHKWRNIGILIGFWIFFMAAYLVAAEFAKPPRNRGEILVFRKWKKHLIPQMSKNTNMVDAQNQPHLHLSEESKDVALSSSIFHWEDLCYDIKIKGKDRRLLDHVDGWVKPGKITALMGVSGAGKTTLLDVLATRITMGVVSGETMINGKPTDASFQHRVGYAQQQDLHLSTMTVREALQFSATLRQSAEIPRSEKLDYVEYVIDLLDMQFYADAVIGVPGEGLNVEQRKRLTIGVELAARPQLLIFLDEPTSGLDSQTSWAICKLIKKLTNSGQAILCTIHQPSSILFNEFDRLLLIAPGGKTAYFGDLGDNSRTLIDYFERNGASPIPADANPAEWMLQILDTKNDEQKQLDWHQIWRDSLEYQAVKTELKRVRALGADEHANPTSPLGGHPSQHQEFVASFTTQLWEVMIRTFKHFWRLPDYIYSKTIMCILYALYTGFSYTASDSIQGTQMQMWAIFMLLVLLMSIHEQMMPIFVPQRNLYEVRERPSKIYQWQTFLLSNILVEMLWNSLMAVIMFFCVFYPVGYVDNMHSDTTVRSFLVFLFTWQYLLLTSTLCHLAITWIDLPESASSLTNFLWVFCILFCGVPVPRRDLPSFWVFMNRVSPTTYLVGGMASTAIAGYDINCAPNEILHITPPANSTCSDFLEPYALSTGGRVLTPTARDICAYCPIDTSNTLLAGFNMSYSTRWRDFGLLWVYILVNVGAAIGFYWVFRVPKGKGIKRV